MSYECIVSIGMEQLFIQQKIVIKSAFVEIVFVENIVQIAGSVEDVNKALYDKNMNQVSFVSLL